MRTVIFTLPSRCKVLASDTVKIAQISLLFHELGGAVDSKDDIDVFAVELV